MRTIHPHVFRSLKTYFASWTKNDDLSMAAMPQMMFRTPTIMIMIPAKSTQPAPSGG